VEPPFEESGQQQQEKKKDSLKKDIVVNTGPAVNALIATSRYHQSPMQEDEVRVLSSKDLIIRCPSGKLYVWGSSLCCMLC
jgi:hypothetical protein